VDLEIEKDDGDGDVNSLYGKWINSNRFLPIEIRGPYA